MTFPNPKWNPDISTVLDAGPAVDLGSGLVGLPITGNAFEAGQIITIAGTTNYNGDYEIQAKTTDQISITETYVAETFDGSETVVFSKQVILKDDFRALEDAITGQGTVRMQPPLIWVDAHTVKVLATPDCPAAMQMTGLPNILNYSVQVGGGLTDGKVRSVTSDVTLDVASGGIWGSEKVSQWYAAFALAGDSDSVFTLKAMPLMRVKSQAGQVISLGTLTTPATGIGYGFTTDELIDGVVYVLTGTSRGLIRTISANNNDNSTGGTITYSGAAMSLTQGDWFIVLPPSTNFRMVGTFFNDSSGDIVQFRRLGNIIKLFGGIAAAGGSGSAVEDIRVACPFAIQVRALMIPGHEAGHPDLSATLGGSTGQSRVPSATPGSGYTGDITFEVEFCRYWIYGATFYVNAYIYPPGCGY